MAVNAKDFVEKIYSAYTEKWGYIWGQAGTTWTNAKQDALEKKYNSDPEKYSDYEKGAKYGAKWIGHKVADCSGLPYCKLKEMGVSIHHGSNSIWKSDLSHKGKIVPGMKLPIGAAIFTGTESSKPHIGTLTSESTVTEAKGTTTGVVLTSLSLKKWTYWGLYKGVTYDFIPGEDASDESVDKPVELKTVCKGDKGDLVKLLQTTLLELGESLQKYGADGKFGNETLKAVKNFQTNHGLAVDGIVGPKTWAELMKGA